MTYTTVSPGQLMLMVDRSLIGDPWVKYGLDKKKSMIKWFLDMCSNIGVRDCNERIGSVLMANTLFETFMAKYNVSILEILE